MTETPDEIAAGLTKAQRTTVLSGREPDGRGKWPTRNALSKKELFRTHPWAITTLGLAVRAILERKPQ